MVLSSALSPCATVLAVLASATAGVAIPATGSGFSCALPGLTLASQQAGSRTPLPKPWTETCPSLATQSVLLRLHVRGGNLASDI